MATVPRKWQVQKTQRAVACITYDSSPNASGEAFWGSNQGAGASNGVTYTLDNTVAGNQANHETVVGRLTSPNSINLFTDLGIGTQYPG